jgi:S1-C subfamily serine protease
MTLEPLTLEDQERLAILLLNAFGPKSASARSDPSRPASLADAWNSLRRDYPDLAGKVPAFALSAFARRLERAGFLEPAGMARGPSVPLHTCYWFMSPLTRLQRTGTAWLSAALGWSHLYRLASRRVCMLEVNSRGQRACGSGFLLPGGVIVTNRHVLEDGTVERVWVGDLEVEFGAPAFSQAQDVGVVRTNLTAAGADGFAFRDHVAVEPVLMLGYPTIPLASETPLTAQTGETCGPPVDSHCAGPQLLVSAVARPGNSGGPVFAQDGRIVGLVARSLHREDHATVPFFAAIPAAAVRAALEEIDPAIVFPWETWEQG